MRSEQTPGTGYPLFLFWKSKDFRSSSQEIIESVKHILKATKSKFRVGSKFKCKTVKKVEIEGRKIQF